MELTELDGVGPARSDRLVEAGYEEVEDLVGVDDATLAEDADVPKDTALEFIVQAENLVLSEEVSDGDSLDADSDDATEESPLPGELAEESEDVEEEANPASEDESGEEVYTLTVDLETDLHYDAYLTALFEARQRRHGSHQPSLEAIETVLDDARYNNGEVTHTLTEYELNTLHAAVSQQSTAYKGANMIPWMEAMDDVLAQINEVRDEELF